MMVFEESKLCSTETPTSWVLTWAVASYIKLEEFAFPIAFLLSLVQIMEFFLLYQWQRIFSVKISVYYPYN